MCELNKKFKEWKKWYSDGENSICAQISCMLLDAAIFYAINEARRHATTDAQGNPELNCLVHDFIDRSFLKTQALSIRKLCDNRNDVISLRILINDMETNKSIITREKILFALEFLCDYGQGTNMQEVHLRIMHKNIDLLVGVSPQQRQPNDFIQDCIFDRLKKWLDKCEPIINSVNKIVAHAATQKSKEKVPTKDLTISLAKIHKAHCCIVRVAAFIGQVILYESSGWNFLPTYAGGDKFEYIERPLIMKNNIEKLEILWSSYDKHIKQLSTQPEKRFIKK